MNKYKMINKFAHINDEIDRLENRISALEKILEFEIKKTKIIANLYKRPNSTLYINATDITNSETILAMHTKGNENE